MAEIILDKASLRFPLFSSNVAEAAMQLSGKGETARARRIVDYGVTALNAISLDIQEGMRIGLVGENGAGKTTLLKLCARIYLPDSGHVQVDGRLTSLITLRGGFDPRATGRQNIKIRSYLQGQTRREVKDRIEDIIAFADLGDFIDLPVSTYSAGMTARLSLAIATAYSPEILLIDEGIMAGDEAFRSRAKARIDRFIKSSGILIIAAHNRAMLADMCTHALWLDKGEARQFGEAQPVLDAYGAFVRARSASAGPEQIRLAQG